MSDVVVWRFDPDGLLAAEQARLAARLGPAERERYARIRDAAARARSEAVRGMLRELLARELGREPGIREGPQGKPHLERGELRFSVAHTEGLALIALARGLELGVDVERARELVPRELSPVLAPAELDEVAALPAAERSRAALRRFVRKEALLKGLGTGLGGPVEPSALALPAGEAWAPCELAGYGRWWLSDLPLAPFLAALAVQAPEPPAVHVRVL